MNGRSVSCGIMKHCLHIHSCLQTGILLNVWAIFCSNHPTITRNTPMKTFTFETVVKFLKHFRLYEIKKNYKLLCGNRANKTTIVKITLTRKELPYCLTKIELFGFGKAQILSCSLKVGKKLQSIKLNKLSKNKKVLKLNQLITHYGNKKITLIVETSYSKHEQTLALFSKEENKLYRTLEYVKLHNFNKIKKSI